MKNRNNLKKGIVRLTKPELRSRLWGLWRDVYGKEVPKWKPMALTDYYLDLITRGVTLLREEMDDADECLTYNDYIDFHVNNNFDTSWNPTIHLKSST
jgi:hypothetical protein